MRRPERSPKRCPIIVREPELVRESGQQADFDSVRVSVPIEIAINIFSERPDVGNDMWRRQVGTLGQDRKRDWQE